MSGALTPHRFGPRHFGRRHFGPRHFGQVLLRVAALLCVVIGLGGCGSSKDSAEEHRRLSLRVEHRPPRRAEAGQDAEIRAMILSSLDTPRIEGWVRIVEADGDGEHIPLEISDSGDAVARIPARPRGEVVHYLVEARDAAGLVVTLPRGARDGKTYALRFEGGSSRILGGISWLSTLLAVLLFLGAGAAAAQALRGHMSVGPSGMLGGFGAGLVVVGLLIVGGIHAFQLTGRPWPSSSVILSISRGELALITLIWIANLILGRRLLMDEGPDDPPSGQRGFAIAGAVAGVLTLVFLLF